ncbi:dual oxidase maturation factor 1 [Leptinotarsa decemlineata]|uniref:dual oxidase maturation factor 1 n=1 Tax=Leptinotarsa decemlineata TaxID=7539 RepID=UPI000C2549A1|nr:dual oxidase maturation factor 1-like [Leptinotarsa decemlineata]
MWFGFARDEGFPTQYEANATPVTVDVLDAGLITASVILAFSFFVSYLTTNKKTNIILYTRISVNILIGAFLLINNFGQDWEVGHVLTTTPYRAGTGQEINASISLKIGLRSVNITLKAKTEPEGDLQHEIIDYNERFEWTWDQGRFGFGPYAGHLQQQFRAAQYRGLPLPILWIVDYFVIDGEGQRFGRFYRTAGWYTHILMWAAFVCWLLANILFRSVIHYGAYILGLCGALQLFANFIYLVVRNPFPLVIPFEDGTIITKFGFHYWCTFVVGIFCLSLSAVILFMDYQYDEYIYNFFGVNPLNSYDEVVYLTKEERLHLRPKKSSNDIPLVPLESGSKQEEDDDDVDYVPVYLKRKTEVLAPKVNRYNKPAHLLS